MSYISKNEQVLRKIQKYTRLLKDIYNDIKDMPYNQLEDSRDALACAQCITNIYEISHYLTNDIVIEKLSFLGSLKVSGIRNISAHNYEALNWDIVKKVCVRLINEASEDVINDCIGIVKEENSHIKDYTKGGELSDSLIFNPKNK